MFLTSFITEIPNHILVNRIRSYSRTLLVVLAARVQSHQHIHLYPTMLSPNELSPMLELLFLTIDEARNSKLALGQSMFQYLRK